MAEAEERGYNPRRNLRLSVDQDFQLGPWLVRPSLNSISRNGSNLRLEPKAMEILVSWLSTRGASSPRRS